VALSSHGWASPVSASTIRASTPKSGTPARDRRSALVASSASSKRGSSIAEEATGLVSVMPQACRIGSPTCSR
jgi:hypothetical protein